MAKEEGTKIAVVGGSTYWAQQYAGTVGGQSTSFTVIDSEIKSTKLKDNVLTPPDFIGNCYQGLTWRLGFGIDNKDEPEEWQNHEATDNVPLTLDTYVMLLSRDGIPYLMLVIVSIARMLSGRISPHAGGLTCNRSVKLYWRINYAAWLHYILLPRHSLQNIIHLQLLYLTPSTLRFPPECVQTMA
jgi:hypothetical protein